MIPRETALRWVRDRLADTPAAEIRLQGWWLGLGAELEELLAGVPDGPMPPQTVGPQATPTAQGPARVPLCVHLGAAVGLQPGVPCGLRRRQCSEFGECSLVGPPGVGAHYCRDSHGAVACAEFEAKD